MARLKLLGGATIVGDDGRVLGGAVARRHPLGLLALLASSSPSPVSRGKAAGLLWPKFSEQKARRRLNACVYRVRQQLGDESVLSVGDDLVLDPAVLSCDVVDFEQAMAGQDHPRAAELYEGPFLEGFRLGGSADFEHWVDRERAHLEAGYSRALEELARAAAERGEGEVAVRWWRERLAADPYDSRVVRCLMESWVTAGNPAAALRVAQEHTRLLEEEFGTAPPREVRELASRLSDAGRERKEARSRPAASAEQPAAALSPEGPSPVGFPSPSRSPRARRLAIGVAASALLGVGILVAWPYLGSLGAPRSTTEERSVAVLPLDDASPAGEDRFLAEAMTEEITSALSEVPELTVRSRSSASRFEDSGMTLSAFARTLGVGHVIEGSIQRIGDRVRISVQLIDARTDEHVWAETYERELTDLFEVQAEVARNVADRLAASFTERERDRILAGATADPMAYDLYLQARSSGAATLEERIGLLRRAVERDSTFWPAWRRLATSYLLRERRGEGSLWADSSRAAFRRAITHAEASQVPRLEAYQAMIFGGDESEAIARLRAAAEARPSDVALLADLGGLYRIRGQLPEAARWLWRAALLDPLEGSRWQSLFPLYWWAGLYGPAERILRRGLEAEPGSQGLWYQSSLQGMIQGRFQEALAAMDSAGRRGRPHHRLEKGFVRWWAGDVDGAASIFSTFDPDSVPAVSPHLPIPMAAALMAAGDSSAGWQIVERFRDVLESQAVERFEPEWRVFPALQLAALEGDVAEAVELFRTYVERGGRDYTWFLQSPLFRPLRDEPDFRRELDALKLRVEDMSRQMESELPRLDPGYR